MKETLKIIQNIVFLGGGAYFNTFNHCLDILDPHFANADLVYRLAYTELNFSFAVVSRCCCKTRRINKIEFVYLWL